MKKIILFISVFLVSFFSFWLDTSFAVSYNWSSTFSIPNWVTSSGVTLLYWQTAPTFVYQSSFSSGAWVMKMQTTMWFKINPSSTASWLIQDITYCQVNNCSSAWNEIHTRYYYDSITKYFRLEFDDSSYPSVSPERILTFALDDAPSCVWASTDCIVIFIVWFTSNNWEVSQDSLRVLFYTKANWTMWYHEDFSSNVIKASWFTLPNSYSIINYIWYSSTWWVQAFNFYQPIASSSFTDPLISVYYFTWYTNAPWYDYSQSYPLFMGSSWTTNSTISTGSTDEVYFSDCSSWLDVWCYIQASWYATKSLLNPYNVVHTYLVANQETTWSLIWINPYFFELPPFDDLWNGLCRSVYTSSSTTNLLYSDYHNDSKLFWNYISWVLDKLFEVLNPIIDTIRAVFFPVVPPLEGDEVCYIWKIFTIEYQRFIPTESQIRSSYVPDSYNPNIWYTKWDSTLFDWIAYIFIISITLPLMFKIVLQFQTPSLTASVVWFAYKKILMIWVLALIPPFLVIMFSGYHVADFINFLSLSLVLVPSYFLAHETIVFWFWIITLLTYLYILLTVYNFLS